MVSQVTEKIVKQLQKANLSTEDRIALTTALLDKLVALPLGNSIVVNPNGVIINGKPLDQEQYLNFKESCTILEGNFARQVIQQQIRYLAINLGINVALSLDTIMFAKAALWCIEQEQLLLEKIAVV